MILWMLGCATQGFIERQQALCHPDAGCVERTFWRDADGDGWGDPDETQVFDWPDAGWVDNARDCDDSDDTVGARLGAACVAGTWATDGEVEWLFASDLQDLPHAAATCGPSGFAGELGGDVALLQHAPLTWEGWLGTRVEELDTGWGPLVTGLDASDPVFGGVDGVRAELPGVQAPYVCSRLAPSPDDYASLVLP